MIITTCTTTEPIWINWAGTTTSTTSSITGEWEYWTNATTTSTATYATCTSWDAWTTDGHIARRVPRPIETAEQIATQKRERNERMELERARKAKARRLLMDVLDAKQRDDLAKHNYFFVTGGKSGSKYRIDHGRAGNVKLMVKGKVEQSYCIHPAIMCPNEDTMLAQMIMLEHMEDQFKNTANITYH